MITSLIVTLVLIVAGLILFWQLYDATENETNKMLILVGYLLFSLVLIVRWFAKYIIEILSM